MSESKLYAAISAVMKDIIGVVKDGQVTGKYGYPYITADKALSSVGDSMAKHGLVIIPSITKHETSLVTYTSNAYGKIEEKTRYESIVKFNMIVACSESETTLTQKWIGYGVNQNSPDKSYYAAITSGHKYFYLKLFAVSVDNTDSEHDKEPQNKQEKPTYLKGDFVPNKAPKTKKRTQPTKPKQTKQAQKPPVTNDKQQVAQTPREWLSKQTSITYATVQTALVRTDKFINHRFAFDMIESFDYPNGIVPTKSKSIYQVKSALDIFDWCVENNKTSVDKDGNKYYLSLDGIKTYSGKDAVSAIEKDLNKSDPGRY